MRVPDRTSGRWVPYAHCRSVVDAESVAESRGYPGKRTRHRHHSVNTDVTSADFLQPVDNSGSGDNSTKTTTFVLAKYHSEAVPHTFTRTQHNIAFLVK